MKICAVVVTYNRKDLLVECLEALRRQTGPLDAIYIIDNASTDGTPHLLMEGGYIDNPDGSVKNLPDHHGGSLKIVYVRLNENTGGAGGFYEGVKRAFHDGYDWIWLMDDDVEPEEYTLEKLLRASERIPEDISAVAPVRFFQGSLFNRETRPSTSEIP
ncbi:MULTISPECIES: glycosyltransferase [Methanothermobacter]|jgi:GT2 family glycosyltransferase|uniref:glycosyltransferase n=1 Tax=Methanothermobacter TaxID=145260 RepID=UPI000B5FAC17|nr:MULTISPECIES: glycosyltransferase [Methanothermobacter]MDI6818578.1 glycosyltransferase [Methanothermobacter thermautotrophicus]BAZ98393.1 Galactofuranosyl transferase GlfT1 [Methanothermobacter sp. EMTCatA1]